MSSPNGSRGAPARPVRVVAVPLTQPIAVRFLGPYFGLLTHWAQKRSHPCLGEERCPPSIHRARPIWKGYAPVDVWEIASELWIPGVLEITESLEHQLAGRKLRGEAWLLTRTPEKGHGPIVGAHSETFRDEQLRPAFDIRPTLERFYHTIGLQLGVPNPIPRQTFLEPQEGPSPKLLGELSSPRPEERPADAETLETFRKKIREMGSKAKRPGPGVNGQLGDQLGAIGQEGGTR